MIVPGYGTSWSSCSICSILLTNGSLGPGANWRVRCSERSEQRWGTVRGAPAWGSGVPFGARLRTLEIALAEGFHPGEPVGCLIAVHIGRDETVRLQQFRDGLVQVAGGEA